MTPGLLRPLSRAFDQQTGKSTREYENTNHHFSWINKKHSSPPQQQQQNVASFNRGIEREKRKSMTLGSWSHNILPGKALLFDKLAKLKKKTSQQPNVSNHSHVKPLFSGPQTSNHPHYEECIDDPLIVVCDFCTSTDINEPAREPEWLNIEKSVRFSLPESTETEKESRHKERENHWGYYQPTQQEERHSSHRKRDKLSHTDTHYPNSNKSCCSDHSMKRHSSYGEGLDELHMSAYQYAPDPNCCSCWCTVNNGTQPFVMVPPSCSHCFNVPPPMIMSPRQCVQVDERYAQYPPPQQVSRNLNIIGQLCDHP